jgi:hypothetical protein
VFTLSSHLRNMLQGRARVPLCHSNLRSSVP